MKEQPKPKITHEDIIDVLKDIISIFSDSREELRSTDKALKKSLTRLKISQDQLRNDMVSSHDQLRTELLVSQEKLKEELREEIRAARYESKMADEELKDELRSFKYEMNDFRIETNTTLKQHDIYFENIQQDIIIFGGLEARVSRLEKAHS